VALAAASIQGVWGEGMSCLGREEADSYWDHWSHGDFTDSISNPGDPELRWEFIEGRLEVCDPLMSTEPRPFAFRRSTSSTHKLRTPVFDKVAFLRHAAANAPHTPEPTASGFGGWVYSLYATPSGGGMLGANEDKKRVFTHRYSQLSEWVLMGTEDWEIVHDSVTDSGIENAFGKWSAYYEVPELLIHGVPLRASPDIVYQHKGNRQVFIVSLGVTSKAVPTNLWPDVWAQLWVYAHIPIWKPYVTNVVGEVWGRRHPKMERMVRPWDMRLRAVVRRDPRTRGYDRFFSALFDIYRGSKR